MGMLLFNCNAELNSEKKKNLKSRFTVPDYHESAKSLGRIWTSSSSRQTDGPQTSPLGARQITPAAEAWQHN